MRTEADMHIATWPLQIGLLAIIGTLIFPHSSSNAFTVDGYSSGMSTEQLILEANSRAREAFQLDDWGGWAVGKKRTLEIDATFFFLSQSTYELHTPH
jgi:hypothetical protein